MGLLLWILIPGMSNRGVYCQQMAIFSSNGIDLLSSQGARAIMFSRVQCTVLIRNLPERTAELVV